MSDYFTAKDQLTVLMIMASRHTDAEPSSLKFVPLKALVKMCPGLEAQCQRAVGARMTGVLLVYDRDEFRAAAELYHGGPLPTRPPDCTCP